MFVALNSSHSLPARLGGLHGLYGVSASLPDGLLQTPDLRGKLILVNPIHHWTEGVTMMLLAPPFEDGGFLVTWDRDAQAEARLRQAYPGWPLAHYYPDQPGVLSPSRR